MLILWISRIRQALKKYTAIVVMILSVLLFGSVAFYYFERGSEQVESIWDALYWLIATVTTVGYGDIAPRTAGGRITFVLVALGGIGAIAYVIEEVIAFTTRSQLRKMLGTGAVKMKKHTIIAGWNTKAEEATKELISANEQFLVVGSELNQAELNSAGIPFISGDPKKSETLNRCNIKDAKTLIIPLQNDSETITIALSARKLNKDIKIVATCDAREHVEIMYEAGINHVISHTEIGGRLIARAVNESAIVHFITDATTSTEGINLRQIEITENMKLSDVLLKNDEKVIALYRGNRFILNLTCDIILEKGDSLVTISYSHK